MTVELKPCPFCGSPAEIHCDEWGGFIADCSDLQCRGFESNSGETLKEDAAKAWNARPSPWIMTSVKLPPYGEPVLIIANGAPQHATYIRDGADDCEDWYEPYHFEHDDNCKAPASDVTHWMPIPELPDPS